MRVLEAEFLAGAADPAGAGWPAEGPPEIAFAGRSNVGKSTLLGALTQRKGLVRVSSTPGRTRQINFFRLLVQINDDRRELRFIDLPGFGYAKVAKSERETWFPLMSRYLGERKALTCCVLLCDARRVADGAEPSGARRSSGALFDETELNKWLRERGVTVIPVMTKADKLSKHERRPAQEALKRALGAPPVVVSGTTGEGVEELWRRLLSTLARPRPDL